MTRAKTSPVEWSIRLLLAVAAMLLAWQSVSRTLAMVLRDEAPEQAYGLAPRDGRIGALWSAALSGTDAAPPSRAQADAVARAALRHDPTAVAAVATLGTDAQARGDVAAARRIFAYLIKLSRRNLDSHVWAINDAASRNDVTTALRHYDLALRTNEQGGDLLFPILASAITEPEVRKGLTRMIAAGTPWGNDFTIYAAGTGPSPQAVVQLLTSLRQAGAKVSESAQSRVVDKLLAIEDVDGAWAYYRTLRPGVRREESRDPRFDKAYSFPTSFDWVAGSGDGITASFNPASQDGKFQFAISTNAGGIVLHQMQMLPPGTYKLEGRIGAIDPPDATLPYWSLICRNGRELGRVKIAPDGRFSGALQVGGPECGLQLLSLVAPPSDRILDSAAQVIQAKLYPVGR